MMQKSNFYQCLKVTFVTYPGAEHMIFVMICIRVDNKSI